MNFDKSFFKGVLRESDGTPSASRSLSALIVFAVIGWVTFLVIRTHTLPPLQEAGMFLSTSTAALYGTNKVSSAISSILGKKAEPDPSDEHTQN